MKTFKYFLLAAAAATAVSCAKEINPDTNEVPETDLVQMTFKASADASDTDTKVAYENKTTVWKDNDKIKVITSNGTVTEFTAESVSEDGKTATFSGLTESSAESYYAVYPAQAYSGDGTEVKEGKLYVNIPDVQTPAADSFDPKAFVSIAKNDGENLLFKNSCAVVGFQITEPSQVKSVRFQAAGVTNLAGTGVVKTDNLPSHTYDQSYTGTTTYDIITINAPADGFQKETYYYFTMRPNNCADGISIYIEYADGIKSRTSTNRLFTNGSQNKIKKLGTIDQNLSDVSPYNAYEMGFDLVVGGHLINKNTYGDATHITSESTATGLNTDHHVYFIDSDAEAQMNSNRSIIVIGNDPEKRSKVSRTGHSFIPATAQEDYWILSNIEFALSDITAGYSLQLNGNDICETVIMDNCLTRIPSSAADFFYANNNNAFKNIVIRDSEFIVSASSANSFIKAQKEHTIDEITFENNVFYAEDVAVPASSFVLITATNPTVTKLSLNRNTFYGAMGTTSLPLTNCKITHLNITNNMFVVQSVSQGNVHMATGNVTESINVSNNGCYIDNSNTYRIAKVNTFKGTTATANDQPASKAMTKGGWDPSNGKFTVNELLGATR